MAPSLLDVTFRPAHGWAALREADPGPGATFLRHVLPLSLLPALAWPVGQASSGRLPYALAALGGSFAATLGFVIASILALAAGLFVLSPAFAGPRHWGRSFAVAAYAATPILLSGALLFLPVLIIASLVAGLHSCALCYIGVQRMLGCREAEAASFVAAASMFALVASVLLGGLCSAAGLI
jgi:hypothetical protein